MKTWPLTWPYKSTMVQNPDNMLHPSSFRLSNNRVFRRHGQISSFIGFWAHLNVSLSDSSYGSCSSQAHKRSNRDTDGELMSRPHLPLVRFLNLSGNFLQENKHFEVHYKLVAVCLSVLSCEQRCTADCPLAWGWLARTNTSLLYFPFTQQSRTLCPQKMSRLKIYKFSFNRDSLISLIYEIQFLHLNN